MYHIKKLTQSGFDHVVLLILFVVAFGIVGSAYLIYTHALSDDQFRVYSKTSNTCLDNDGDKAANGTNVVVWTCKGASGGTLWARNGNLIETAAGDYCLDDWGQSKVKGTQVRLYKCSATDPAQVWDTYGVDQYRNPSSGLCLDDYQGSAKNGDKVDLYTCKTTSRDNQEWFIEPASATISSGGGSTSGGGGSTGSSTTAPAIPTAVPSGYKRIFTEDFNTPAALGSFTSVYGSEFGEYTGCCSTNKFTQYSPNTVLYVKNGSLYYDLYSSGGTSYAAAPQPMDEKSFLYGQYGISVKLDSTTGPGYKIAFLLWPETNAWSNEVDFPEVDPDFTAPVRAASLNYSPNGDGENGFDTSQDNLSTGVYLTDKKYHTFLLTWTPGKMVATIDGKTVATFTGSAVPSQPMRLSMQAEGWINQGAVPASTTDVLEVPWVYINQYN